MIKTISDMPACLAQNTAANGGIPTFTKPTMDGQFCLPSADSRVLMVGTINDGTFSAEFAGFKEVESKSEKPLKKYQFYI